MAGIDGFGVAFFIDVDDDQEYSFEIGELTDADFMDISVEDIDTTSHGSPDKAREFIGGLMDGGELSFTVNFDPAMHGDILDVVGKTHRMKFVFPPAADDAELLFTGHINSMSGTSPIDDKLESELSVKVSGRPSLVMPS